GGKPELGLIVKKEKIAENGDYNLSGERYRQNIVSNSKFSLRKFEEVCSLEYGASLPKEKRIDGTYPVVGSNGITGWHDQYLIEGPAIIVGRKGSAGEVTLIDKNCFPIDTTYYVKQTKPDESDLTYLYWILKGLNLPELKNGAGIPGLNRSDVYNAYQIPLPPLEIQKEIVSEIEGYQKVINGARAVLDNYRPHISIHPDWPVVPLSDLFITKSGTTPRRDNLNYFTNGHIPWVKTLDLNNGAIHCTEEKVTDLALAETHLEILPKGTVLVAMYGGFNQIGRTGVLEIEAVHNQAMTALLPTPKVSPYYLNAILVSSREYWKSVANSTRKDPNITKSDVINFKLPLPNIETQLAIVAEIEAEQELVAANRELITRFEKKIQATLALVWGEEPELEKSL
ncbi:MAG: restriction endonuclease subunit S, partial [Methylococcales bacterium]